MKNSWIFGGTGYIGKSLVHHLTLNSTDRLQILLHKSKPYRFLEPFNTFTGNLESFDLSWFKQYPPDTIYHLARIGGRWNFTRKMASKRGKKANRRLIDSMLTRAIKPKIIYVSGSLMFGHQHDHKPVEENAKLNPTAYAKYYFKGEAPWIEAKEKAMLDIRFARPGWIMGPASWFKVFYWDYFLKHKKIPVYGSGKQMMSLVHVNDCAGQIHHLAEKGDPGQDLNIFGADAISQEEFATKLAGMLSASLTAVSGQQIAKSYGKTIAEALTSSIPLGSMHEYRKNYQPQFPHVDSMIKDVVSSLHDKERVFAKTP